MSVLEQLVMDRDELLDRLRSQLVLAEERDAANLATHKLDEAAYLKAFRAACSAAKKWDYATAKRNHFDPMSDVDDEGTRHKTSRPSCPLALAPRYREAIRLVEMDSRTRYTLREGYRSATRVLHELVTWTPTPTDMSGGC